MASRGWVFQRKNGDVMLSLVMQRIFSAVFIGLMMLSPAMASDLMFGALQFRATI